VRHQYDFHVGHHVDVHHHLRLNLQLQPVQNCVSLNNYDDPLLQVQPLIDVYTQSPDLIREIRSSNFELSQGKPLFDPIKL
jgi:hypothetical protein